MAQLNHRYFYQGQSRELYTSHHTDPTCNERFLSQNSFYLRGWRVRDSEGYSGKAHCPDG